MMKPEAAERMTGYKVGGISPLGQRKCRVVLKSETARAGGYSLPLNVRFCFRKQRASQVLFHYLINCGK